MFKDVLKQLREEKGLTQELLAHELGLSSGSIGNYEQGSREPRNKIMRKIADYFGVSIDYLLGNNSDLNQQSDFNTPFLTNFNPNTQADKTKIDLINTFTEIIKSENDINKLKQIQMFLNTYKK